MSNKKFPAYFCNPSDETNKHRALFTKCIHPSEMRYFHREVNDAQSNASLFSSKTNPGINLSSRFVCLKILKNWSLPKSESVP